MKMKQKKVFALILLILCWLVSAAAEESAGERPPGVAVPEGQGFLSTVLSLEKLKEKTPEEKRWFFTLGAWYEKKLGNTDMMRVNGSALVEFNNGVSEFIISWLQFYSEKNGDRFEENGTGIIKFDHYLISMLEIFLFSQLDYNIITGLRLRSTSGAGLKFVFFRNRYWTTDVSAAPVFEYERYTPDPTYRRFRASFRYRLKIRIMERLSLNGTVFYVPLLDNFRKYRFNIDAEAVLNVTAHADREGGVMLKGGYRRQYSTFVLPKKKKLDEFYYAQVQLKL